MAATILIVDDDEPIVDLVATVLEDEGHRVLRAYDGAEALARIKQDSCDMLITDNMMPKLSGVALIAYLRAHPAFALPVILMSAVTPRPMPALISFLPKPFDIERLVALVSRILAAR